MEEDGEEHEGNVESDGVERDDGSEGGQDSQFLSVPSQTITASSSGREHSVEPVKSGFH